MNNKAAMGLAEIIALTLVIITIVIAIMIMTKGDPFGSLGEIFKPWS